MRTPVILWLCRFRGVTIRSMACTRQNKLFAYPLVQSLMYNSTNHQPCASITGIEHTVHSRSPSTRASNGCSAQTHRSTIGRCTACWPHRASQWVSRLVGESAFPATSRQWAKEATFYNAEWWAIFFKIQSDIFIEPKELWQSWWSPILQAMWMA